MNVCSSDIFIIQYKDGYTVLYAHDTDLVKAIFLVFHLIEDVACEMLIYSSTPCRFGEKCTSFACSFRHPLSRPLPDPNSGAMPSTQPFKTSIRNVPCRYQPNCTNPACPFQHSSKQNANAVTRDRPFSVEQPVASVSELINGQFDPDDAMDEDAVEIQL